MTSTETAPTAEADPQSLSTLFEADPEDLTDNDIDTIVSHFREKRHLFLQQEETKKATGRSSGTKSPPKNLSLDDLLA